MSATIQPICMIFFMQLWIMFGSRRKVLQNLNGDEYV